MKGIINRNSHLVYPFSLIMLAVFIGFGTISCAQNSDQKQEVVKVQPASIAKTVSVEEFSKLINSKKGLLLDVRTPKEVADGKIAGATNIDYYDKDFKANIEKLDKSTPVMVYCRSGHRSGNTMQLMKELGFKEVYNLDGGFMAWKADGKDVSK